MCVCGQGGLSWDVYFLVIVTKANLSLVISFCALEQRSANKHLTLIYCSTSLGK